MKKKPEMIPIQSIPNSVTGDQVFIRGKSIRHMMTDLADVFKPHKYSWPLPKKELEDLCWDAFTEYPDSPYFIFCGWSDDDEK